MEVTQGYQHKKFDTLLQYEHKKFGQRCIKRKRETLNEMTTNIMASDTIPNTELIPPAKRRQTQALFRPWLLEEKTTQRQRNFNSITPSTLMKYHSSMVRNHPVKDRSPKAQQRRDQNTLACMKIRRAKKMETLTLEQEYIQLRLKEEAVADASLRAKLYLQELVRMTTLRNASQVMLSSHHRQQVQFLLQQRQQQQQQQQFVQRDSAAASSVFVFGGMSC